MQKKINFQEKHIPVTPFATISSSERPPPYSAGYYEPAMQLHN